MPLPRIERELRTFLQGHILFSLLDEKDLNELLSQVELAPFAIGETVVCEGEAGDVAYLVFSGRVRVFKEGADGKPITLATLARGELLGEQAVLKEEKRSASGRAAEDSVLLRIPGEAFRRLPRDHAVVRTYLEKVIEHRGLARFLQTGTYFGPLPARAIMAVLDQFVDRRFAQGETMVRAGEIGERMFIIKSGEAKVVKECDGQETVLAYLGSGDYFGERALLLDEPRYASVIALADTECATLGRAAFARLLADAPQIKEQLGRKLQQYRAGEELARKFGVRPPAPPPPARAMVWERMADLAPAKPGVRYQGPRGWLGFKKYPFVPQEDEADCGAAALAMIARYHNVPISVERLRHLAHVGAEGASMCGLTGAAETIGYDWRAVTTDYDHLGGMKLPAIAHWQGCHYLVVYEVEAGRVLLGDPAAGLVRLSRAEFEKSWTGQLVLLTPTQRLEQNRAARYAWQYLAALLGGYGREIGLIVALSVVLAGLVTALTLLVQEMIDLWAIRPGSILALPGRIAAVLSLSAVVLALRGSRIHRLVAQLRGPGESLERVLRLPSRFFHARRAGALLAALDAPNQIGQLLGKAMTVCADLLIVPAGFGLLAYAQPALALPALAALFLTALLPGLAFSRMLRDRQEADRRHGDLQSELVETVQNVETIKAAGGEAEHCRRLRAMGFERQTAEAHLARTGNTVAGLGAAILSLGGLAALWHSGLVPVEPPTLGEVVFSAAAWAMIAIPTWHWLRFLPAFLALRQSLQRCADLDDLPAENPPSPVTPAAVRHGLVRCEDICFAHHPEGSAVLAHVTFELAPGRLHWLLGRCGSGKTTLARLFLRFEQPSQGTIRIDGIDWCSAEESWTRRQVALVAHEPAILQGTIRQNVALAEPAASLERVIGAAQFAGAHDFIMRLPRGYDTVLGSPGRLLSSGERLQINLAAAFLKNPCFLILDDPAAMLDGEAARVLLKNLRLLAADRSVLILARYPGGLEARDFAIVLDEGRMVEKGTPAELVKQQGLFASWMGTGPR